MTEKQKAMKDAALAMIEAEKRRSKYERCLRCEWSTLTGVGLYCPFPEGACIRERGANDGGDEK